MVAAAASMVAPPFSRDRRSGVMIVIFRILPCFIGFFVDQFAS
jgi:hypothetical protein